MFRGVWSYVIAAGLAVAFIVGVYQTGYNAAWRTAQVENIKAERDAAKADLATAKAAADRAATQAVDLAAEAATNQLQIKDLADALKNSSAGKCRVGAFGRQLRAIR